MMDGSPARTIEAQQSRGSLLFPRGVRLWHFILLPAVGMALMTLVFRGLEALPGVEVPLRESLAYEVFRIVVISVAMTSLIAWIAFRHRREYESRIRSQNETLIATRDFLSNVIGSSAEAIVTLDDEGRVTSWNRAAEEVYGWSSAEMLGQTLDRLLPEDEEVRAESERHSREVASGKTVHHVEVSRVRKDGTRIPVHVTQSPLLEGDGRFSGSSVFTHDITELLELEHQLREQERLAALGQFSAAVAHEIKNPLAGIRGACELLLEGYEESDPRHEIGVEALRQVDRLNRSVHDLLVFARPRATKPVPTDIHLVLDRVLTMIQEDPESRSVEVARSYAEALPPLNVDPQQMEQVFFNVFLNAMQAMNYRGRLEVATECRDGRALIRIRDSGPGIPEPDAARIFEPFFTTRPKGSGLGLAIVNKIVRAHKGEVSVASPLSAGGGTEFEVALPAEAC